MNASELDEDREPMPAPSTRLLSHGRISGRTAPACMGKEPRLTRHFRGGQDTSRAMSQVSVGREGAVFPPNYKPPLWVPALFRLATLSRRVRAFFFGLPASRFRTWTIGQYYRLLVRQFASGDYGFLRAVAPNAELTLFSMETYREQSGWREALTTWRD